MIKYCYKIINLLREKWEKYGGKYEKIIQKSSGGSISRWTEEDGRKLKHFLEVEFDEKQNRQIYWDDVAMFCHPNDFKLGIRPMNASDIIEVDNLSELIALDESYKKYVEEK